MNNPIPLFEVSCSRSRFSSFNSLLLKDDTLMFHSAQIKTLEVFTATWEHKSMFSSKYAIPLDKVKYITGQKDYRIIDIYAKDGYYMGEIFMKNIAERDRLYELLVQTGKFKTIIKRHDPFDVAMPFIGGLILLIAMALFIVIVFGINQNTGILLFIFMLWGSPCVYFISYAYKRPLREFNLMRSARN